MKSQFLLLLLLGVSMTSAVAQATFTSNNNNGNWGTTSTWQRTSGTDADGIPDADDDVIMRNNITVRMNVNANCNNLTFNGTGELDFNTNNRTLTVHGTATMNGTSEISGTGATRTLELLGDFNIPAGQSGRIAGIQVTQPATRNFTVSGTFTPSSNTGTKNLGNLIINSTGVWNAVSTETYNFQNGTLYDGSSIDGSTTAAINIQGNLRVEAGLAGGTSSIGRINLTVTGTTTVNGYLLFSGSSSGTKTFNNTITVTGDGTWDNVIGEDPVVNCNIVNNGLWPVPTGGTGTYYVNSGNSYTYSGVNEIAMTQLSISGGSTVTNNGTLLLTRNNGSGLTATNFSTFNNGDGGYLKLTSATVPLNISGTSDVDFTTAVNTVEYAFSGDQEIYATTYNNVVCSNGGVKYLDDDTRINNSLTITGTTTVDDDDNDLDGAATLIMTGTSRLSLGSGGTQPQFTGAAHSLAAGTTIEFYRNGTQTAASSATYPYQNVLLSGNGGGTSVNMSAVTLIQGDLTFTNRGSMTNNAVLTVKGTFNFGPPNGSTTLANDITVGNFIFSNGDLTFDNRTITIDGNDGTWTNYGSGDIDTNASSRVIFTTGTNQQITGTVSTTFPNLIIDNANNVSLAGVNATVSETLTLTTGKMVTGSNIVIIPNNASVSRTNGFVEGNLQKYVRTGATSVTFEVGTGTTYSPATVAFANVTGTGNMICSSTAGDHPDINGSGVDAAKSVNRYWTLTNSGINFTSYSATFNFSAADVDATATTGSFQIKSTDGLTWIAATVGTRTATSTQLTGEVMANLPSGSSRQYQIGETISGTGVFNRITGTANWNSADTWIQYRTGTITFTNGSATVTGSGTAFTTELSVGSVLMLQASPGTVRGTVQSITNNTTLVLTANASGNASGSYGRKYIPNSNTDIVTIGNANLADAATTITLNMNATVNALNLNTATTPRTTAQTLTHSAGNTLTVQTDVAVNQPGNTGTDTWNINAGTATIGGSLTLGSGVNSTNRIARVNITTGTLTVGSDLVFYTSNNNNTELSAVVNMAGSNGKLNLGRNLIFINDRGLLLPGTSGSIFNYNRAASGQTILFPDDNQGGNRWVYHNLYCNNTSSDGLMFTENLTTTNVTGDIRVQTGALVQEDDRITGNGTKTFQIVAGAMFRMVGDEEFPNGFGTYDLGTSTPFGTVKYENSDDVDVRNLAYGHLQFLSDPDFTLNSGTTTVAGNLTVGNGTDSPRLEGNGSTLTVTGDINIFANGRLDAGDIDDINVGGNWTNNGRFDEGNNDVNFTGTGPGQPQTIGGNVSETFYNLTINTAATTDLVRLLKSTSVSRTLTLTRGGVDLNGNILNVTRSSTAAIARTNGYLKSEKTTAPYGELNWSTGTATGSFVFPFGKSDTEYVPFTFNITSAGNPAAGSMSIATYHTGADNTPLPSTVSNLYPGDNSANVVDRFWIINANNYTTTRPTATMTFVATTAEVGTITNLQAQRWSPANIWNVPSSSQSNTASSVTISNVSSFSPWALSGNNTPLPVKLVSFKATPQDRTVKLEWITATEVNNDYFTVERSKDGSSFSEVLTVAGAGNSSVIKKYDAVDENPLGGLSYYRLKQTDLDGQTDYSTLVVVRMSNVKSVYPNPSDGVNINLQLEGSSEGSDVLVTIITTDGRQLFSQLCRSDYNGIASVVLPQPLSTGLYIISVQDGATVWKQRLVVKK